MNFSCVGFLCVVVLEGSKALVISASTFYNCELEKQKLISFSSDNWQNIDLHKTLD